MFLAVRRHFLFESSDVLPQTFHNVMKLVVRLICDVHDGVKCAFQLALCRVQSVHTLMDRRQVRMAIHAVRQRFSQGFGFRN